MLTGEIVPGHHVVILEEFVDDSGLLFLRRTRRGTSGLGISRMQGDQHVVRVARVGTVMRARNNASYGPVGAADPSEPHATVPHGHLAEQLQQLARVAGLNQVGVDLGHRRVDVTLALQQASLPQALALVDHNRINQITTIEPHRSGIHADLAFRAIGKAMTRTLATGFVPDGLAHGPADGLRCGRMDLVDPPLQQLGSCPAVKGNRCLVRVDDQPTIVRIDHQRGRRVIVQKAEKARVIAAPDPAHQGVQQS